MEISVCIYNVNNDEVELLQRFVAAVLFHADYRAKVLSCSTEAALRKVTAKYPYVDLLFLPATSFGIEFGEELRKTNRTTTIHVQISRAPHLLFGVVCIGQKHHGGFKAFVAVEGADVHLVSPRGASLFLSASLLVLSQISGKGGCIGTYGFEIGVNAIDVGLAF